jgi:hypothetical protein
MTDPGIDEDFLSALATQESLGNSSDIGDVTRPTLLTIAPELRLVEDQVTEALRETPASTIGLDGDLSSLTDEALAAALYQIAVVILELLPTRRLREVVPVLPQVDDPILATDLPQRALNGLARRDLLRWAALSEKTPTDLLNVRNLGRGSVRSIIALALTVGFKNTLGGGRIPPEVAARHEEADDPGPSVPDGLAEKAKADAIDALAVIDAWGRIELRQRNFRTVLREALAGDVPPEIDRATRALASVPWSRVSERYEHQFDVTAAANKLLGSFDDRSLRILRGRELSLDQPLTLEVLGREIDVTRERIRQLEARAKRILRTRLEEPEFAVITRKGRRIRGLLGAGVPERDIEWSAELVTTLGGWDLDSAGAQLLLWVAGPYVRRGAWIVNEAAAAAATYALFSVLENESISLQQALSILTTGGFVGASAKSWLMTLRRLKVSDDRVMLWHSSAADRAEVLLREAGSPLTTDDLAASMPDRSPRSIANALLSDARFMRTGVRHYGLRGWPYNEYTGILDEIEEEIEARGGEAELADLVETLVARFGVSATSVMSLSGSRRFLRSDGMIRLRESSPFDPDANARAIEFTPACFRLAGGWAWRVAVDDALLRGSGRHVAPGFACEIGLTPGTTASFPWEHGELTFAWGGLQPAVSSIRRGLVEAGAEPGDLYFLQFVEETGAFRGLRVPRTDTDAGPPERALWLETGGIGRRAEPGLKDLGHALGYSDAPTPSVRAIQRRLRARREVRLMELLDEALSPVGSPTS